RATGDRDDAGIGGVELDWLAVGIDWLATGDCGDTDICGVELDWLATSDYDDTGFLGVELDWLATGDRDDAGIGGVELDWLASICVWTWTSAPSKSRAAAQSDLELLPIETLYNFAQTCKRIERALRKYLYQKQGERLLHWAASAGKRVPAQRAIQVWSDSIGTTNGIPMLETAIENGARFVVDRP
ncbi:hypothetical protein G3M48_009668, partial [Beauveria asiatica]